MTKRASNSIAAQLQRQQAKAEIAKAKLVEAQAMALFSALEPANHPSRRPPPLEFGTEDVMLGFDRAQLTATCRNLYRKTPAARAAIDVLCRHVYGSGPNLTIYPDNESPAATWFNNIWGPHADARGILDIDRFNNALLRNWLIDGDAVVFFDRYGTIPGSEGKMWAWESDQLCTICKTDWNDNRARIAEAFQLPAGIDLCQADGIIADQYGRVWGFVVSHKRAGSQVRYCPDDPVHNQCTILTNGPARLLVSPWRIGQTRGEGSLATSAEDHQYIQQIRAALLSSLNVQAMIALFVKTEDPEGLAQTRRDDAESTDGELPGAGVEPTKCYRNFEKLARNAIEYGAPGDSIEALDLGKRGDINSIALLEAAQQGAGYSMGLARLYAQGKSDGSYSGSMAEENLSWPTILEWRKLVERCILDYEAESAIGWALETGLTTDPGEGWQDRLGWVGYPERQAINPGDAASALKTNLEIGKINWTDMHGSAAEAKLAALGKQIQHGRDNGYFAPLFAPKPGASNAKASE
jgi:hypothetical protein